MFCLSRFMQLLVLALCPIIANFTPGEAADIYSAHKGINVAAFVGTSTESAGVENKVIFAVDTEKCSDAFVSALRGSGVELVRLVTNPLPLIENNDRMVETAASQVTDCAAAYQRQDIAVVVDLHFWSPEPEATMDKILGNEAKLAAYSNAVRVLARKLSRLSNGYVALELLNEPRLCDGRYSFDWRPIQRALLSEVRKVSTKLPVVVTGCGGQLDGLLNLDMTGLKGDDNLLFTFHFYEPFIFTHQGAYYGSKFSTIRYPSAAVDRSSALVKAAEIGNQAELLSPNRKLETLREIAGYLRQGTGAETIMMRFKQIAVWADVNKIPRGHVFLGEFGAGIGQDSEKIAPIFADCISWVRDVRVAAERSGFSYAWWVFPRQGNWTADSKTRFINPDLLNAIGLNPTDLPITP